MPGYFGEKWVRNIVLVKVVCGIVLVVMCKNNLGECNCEVGIEVGDTQNALLCFHEKNNVSRKEYGRTHSLDGSGLVSAVS